MFDVNVVSPLEFPNWVAGVAKSDELMDADGYRKLLKQAPVSGRPTWRLGDPLLFDAITTQRIPPQPGPQPSKEAAPSYLQTSWGADAICSVSSTGPPFRSTSLSR
jgi:cytochrome o ubiquinol oxidase subunit II